MANEIDYKVIPVRDPKTGYAVGFGARIILEKTVGIHEAAKAIAADPLAPDVSIIKYILEKYSVYTDKMLKNGYPVKISEDKKIIPVISAETVAYEDKFCDKNIKGIKLRLRVLKEGVIDLKDINLNKVD
ncbi:MAG: hypothetical protein LBS41_01000 [Streptococcaceae bacterium]|nr:hypothetical protein [Streptococcaceae bacterium]